MRIVIMTFGSRGDVQPYIALGLGLQRAGYQVCLLTSDIFAPMIEPYGLEFVSLAGNTRKMLDTQAGQRLLESGGSVPRFMRATAELLGDYQEAYMEDALRTLPGADLLLYNPMCFAGSYAAEALQIPAVFVPLQPVIPTRAFPSPLGSFQEYGGIGNWLTHLYGNMVVWQTARPVMQQLRRKLNLKPLPWYGHFSWESRIHQTILLGYSPLVVPKSVDWPQWAHATGYWFLSAPKDWHPPAPLLDFLQAGPPPVYIGFGSMASEKAEESTSMVLKALERTKQRGIIATGWSSIGNTDLPESVFKLEEAPHDWLFPRMAAVVHHAGSGTTSAGLRAGVPNVLVPFLLDQFFWAERTRLLGMSPRSIPRKHLTAEHLAEAITATISDQAMRARAAALGARIRAEDGVGNAVQIVQHLLESRDVVYS